MRRLFRYCLQRQQPQMSWAIQNCYNIINAKPLNERHLNLFQLSWKSKTLVRKFFNGDVTEHSFLKEYKKNHRNFFETLLSLERRLDNTLFRCMFAESVHSARALASSGCVLINNEKVTRPSHQLKDGDVIQIKPTISPTTRIHKLSKHPMINFWSFIPSYLEVDHSTLSAVYLRKPCFDEIPHPFPRYMIDNTSSFYSKKY